MSAISLAALVAAPALAGALLLFAAIPVFADGGPHQAKVNSGASTLKADSCAGCHRAHTAQGEYLLAAADEEALCFSCHGNGGVGATTDVEWGIQYRPTILNARPTVQFDIVSVTTGAGLITTEAAHGFVVGQSVTIAGVTGLTNGIHVVAEASGATFRVEGPVPIDATYSPGAATVTGSNPGAVLGALRGGGFVRAAIDSGNPARQLVSKDIGRSDDQLAKVRVLANGSGVLVPAPVTSAHLNLAANGLDAPTIAWGNAQSGWDVGDGLSGPGPTVVLRCTSCHNPHGNEQYRILNPIPNPQATTGQFWPATIAAVKDSPVDNPDANESDTKNYTVIQTIGNPANVYSYLLYADDVIDMGWGQASGDYWHVRVPWNSESGANDAPNGVPGTGLAFNTQMTRWCSSCHTRYNSPNGAVESVDVLFTWRHETTGNRACTTCHVAHGSNARMEGPYSATQPFPNLAVPAYSINGATGDSRLLKVDGRGTCQLCHDPTDTAYDVPATRYTGPVPPPGIP